VNAVATLILDRVTAQIHREADRMDMPATVRQKFLPVPSDRRALAARLGSAGAGLVRVLDDLEQRGAAALSATALERPDLEAWQDALRAAARRLEDSWLLLEDRVEMEVVRWEPVVKQVSHWRKPLTPVLIVGAAGLLLAVWLGLTAGGFIAAPAIMRPLFSQ
jgi:hypothetical protein